MKLVSSLTRAVVPYADHLPWYLVDAASGVWRALDPPPSLHASLDQLVASLKTKSLFHPHAFYSHGWGHTAHLREYAVDLQRPLASPSPLDVSLEASIHGRAFARVVDGSFAAAAVDELPVECRTAKFQMVIPTSWDSPLRSSASAPGSPVHSVAAEMSRVRPLVILLPGTGEHGFRRRRHCVAYPLARCGVASIVLEGPYYGSRRPAEQHASKLRTLMDLVVLGRSTIDEAVGLVSWLRAGDGSSSSSSAAASTRSSSNALWETGDASLSTGLSDGVGTTRGHTGALHVTDLDVSAIAEAAVASANERHRSGHTLPGLLSQRMSLLAPYLPARRTTTAVPAAEVPTPSDLKVGPIVLAGTSMGGLHSAMSLALLPRHLADGVGCASWLGPPSGAPVFTLGALFRGIDWGTLAAQALPSTSRGDALEADIFAMNAVLPPPAYDHCADIDSYERSSAGRAELDALTAMVQRERARNAPGQPMLTTADISFARRQFARVSAITDITNQPIPASGSSSIFVVANQDQYVPSTASVDRMWADVSSRWGGCEVRSVRGGHVSASIFSIDTYVGTLLEVVRKLMR